MKIDFSMEHEFVHFRGVQYVKSSLSEEVFILVDFENYDMIRNFKQDKELILKNGYIAIKETAFELLSTITISNVELPTERLKFYYEEKLDGFLFYKFRDIVLSSNFIKSLNLDFSVDILCRLIEDNLTITDSVDENKDKIKGSSFKKVNVTKKDKVTKYVPKAERIRLIKNNLNYLEDYIKSIEYGKGNTTGLLDEKVLSVFQYYKLHEPTLYDGIVRALKNKNKSLIESLVEGIISLPLLDFDELIKQLDLNVVNNRLENELILDDYIKKDIIANLYKVKHGISNKFSRINILIYGSPGKGKTTSTKILADILSLPFVHISVPSLDRAFYLVGSDFSYSTSKYGLIAGGLINSKNDFKSAVFLLDEVDKGRYTEDSALLGAICNILDASYNITDVYLQVPLDLSQCIFVLTANDLSSIPDFIIDRCLLVDIDKLYINQTPIIVSLLKGALKSTLNLSDKDLELFDESLFEAFAKKYQFGSFRDLEKEFRVILNNFILEFFQTKTQSELSPEDPGFRELFLNELKIYLITFLNRWDLSLLKI